MNVLSEDSIFGQIFGFLGNMIALNILWLVTSLPIVTIGCGYFSQSMCLSIIRYGFSGYINGIRI